MVIASVFKWALAKVKILQWSNEVDVWYKSDLSKLDIFFFSKQKYFLVLNMERKLKSYYFVFPDLKAWNEKQHNSMLHFSTTDKQNPPFICMCLDAGLSRFEVEKC